MRRVYSMEFTRSGELWNRGACTRGRNMAARERQMVIRIFMDEVFSKLDYLGAASLPPQ
jgi:hypothetical protein